MQPFSTIACRRTCRFAKIPQTFRTSTPPEPSSPRSLPACRNSARGCGPMAISNPRTALRFFYLLSCLLCCLLLSISAYAGDRQHMTEACKLAKETPSRPNFEDCAIKFYGLTPVGPQIGSIAPQGSVALGLRASHTIMHPPSLTATPGTKSKESHFTTRGLYSVTNFYLMEGRYDFKMPALGQGNSTTATFEDQIDLSVFASRVNLNTQRFYGLGENSASAGLAEYRQLQDKVGASADWPITSWFSAGGTVQWVERRRHSLFRPPPSHGHPHSPLGKEHALRAPARRPMQHGTAGIQRSDNRFLYRNRQLRPVLFPAHVGRNGHQRCGHPARPHGFPPARCQPRLTASRIRPSCLVAPWSFRLLRRW